MARGLADGIDVGTTTLRPLEGEADAIAVTPRLGMTEHAPTP